MACLNVRVEKNFRWACPTSHTTLGRVGYPLKTDEIRMNKRVNRWDSGHAVIFVYAETCESLRVMTHGFVLDYRKYHDKLSYVLSSRASSVPGASVGEESCTHRRLGKRVTVRPASITIATVYAPRKSEAQR